MTHKQFPTSIYLSKGTKAEVEYLMQHFGENRSAIIKRAILNLLADIKLKEATE